MMFHRNLLTVLIVLLSAPAVAASVYYLDPARGNDRNDGNEAAPWKTLNKVITSVAAGDKVYVRGGTYTEDQYLKPDTGKRNRQWLPWTDKYAMGAPNRLITVQARPGERVTFDGGGQPHCFFFSAGTPDYRGHYVAIKDLSFRNYRGVAIRVRQAKRILIEGCRFADFTDAAIGAIMLGRAKKVMVRNCRFDNIGVSGHLVHPLYVGDASRDIVLEKNIIRGAAAFGLHCFGGHDESEAKENLVIRRNVVVNSYSAHFILGKKHHRNVYVYNNTFYSTASPYPSRGPQHTTCNVDFRWGKGTLTNVRVLNNIGCGPFREANVIVTRPAMLKADFYLDHNLWWNSREGGTVFVWGEQKLAAVEKFRQLTGHARHSIVADPRFRAPGSFDLSLAAHSLAIDKGSFLTRTVRSGKGREIPVQDAGYFTDGFGVAGGDLIQIGSQRVTIRTVDHERNLIAVDREIAWTEGEGVSLPYTGAMPDIGAYEYDSNSKVQR